MNYILDSFNQLKDSPEGRQKFSELVCGMTPYFSTINPLVEALEQGYGSWSMKKVREVENHIGTVHAIAMCNLCEITAGLTIEVSIPPHRRWIPMSMTVNYLRKAKTDLRAECRIADVDWDKIDQLPMDVAVYDTENQEVMHALITMKVGDRKD